jgi:hypothetical protein
MQSPLLGFNNNVRHRGKLFHIQTEDSGIRHPHVITHLFMDGGRILKTIKTSYVEHLGNEKLAEVVRKLMKEQHKTMFIALRDGQFDYVLDPDEAPPVSIPGVTSTPKDSFQPAQVTASLLPNLPQPVSEAEPPVDGSVPPESHEQDVAASQAPAGPRPGQRREAPDIFAARADAATVDVVPRSASSAPPKKDPRERHSSGRYVASRPAAIFANGRTPEPGGSIFGDDLISEKSLDEVILSYLSEDLDTPGTKK